MFAEAEKAALTLQRNIEQSAPVDELLFLPVFSRIAKSIIEGKNDFGGDAADARLVSWVKAQLVLDKYAEMDSRASFGVGALWGAFSIRQECFHVLSEAEAADARLNLIRKYQSIFDLVERKPGINHGELAAEAGLTPSRLSQIVSLLDDENLLLASRNGKTKHYRLSTAAKHAWAKVCVSADYLSNHPEDSGNHGLDMGVIDMHLELSSNSTYTAVVNDVKPNDRWSGNCSDNQNATVNSARIPAEMMA